jgi:transcriptional regulator with XRE-family HTH domain
MTERILHLMEAERLTPLQLATKLGIDRTGISHFISGRNQPSRVFIEKVLRAFPALNARWFILGDGDPYVTNDPAPSLFDEQPSLVVEKIKNDNTPPPAQSLEPVVQSTDRADKKIEQIVVLNNDGTFRQYKEEKKLEV